ncbi:unnamed protein product [Arctogadus glacialis]
MENESMSVINVVSLDPFYIPPRGRYPIFFLGVMIYLFAIFCNMTLLALIIFERKLHTPMYFILFSLPLNDLVGITAMLPKVLSDIVTGTRKVYYQLCVLQAFLLHMYGGGVLFILAAMAFDRYMAICRPLRYRSVMSVRTVVSIVCLVWGLDFVLILSLFVLQTRLPKCRTAVMNVFCDNPSLLKLSCGNTALNNIVGLLTTAAMQLLSVSVQLFSYIRILVACIGSRRFKNVSPDLQKIMGMLIFLVNPILNPIVYGLKMSEIRNTLLALVKNKRSG